MLKRLRWPLLAALLVVGAVALAACGDDDDGGGGGTGGGQAAATAAATQAPAAEGVAVTLKEWAVEPAESSVAAGEVTFDVANTGAVPHEFVVIRTDLAPDALPTGGGKVDESGLDVAGRIAQFSGGQTQRTTLNLAAGSYVLLCNIPAHYNLGMRVAFTVK